METTVLLISLAIIPVLLALLLLCLKIKTSKSNPDLFGTVGTVTSKDDGDAYLPASLNVSAESGGGEVRTPSYDRKLPELPSEDPHMSTKGKEGDSNSDLYATVDEMPTNNNCMVVGMGPAISLVPDSSHHPYAQVPLINGFLVLLNLSCYTFAHCLALAVLNKLFSEYCFINTNEYVGNHTCNVTPECHHATIQSVDCLSSGRLLV